MTNKKVHPLLEPQWYKDAVIYQLHVKSFFDANNDGVGDFAGLVSKLDYISEIGVTAIWLLPFYPSPRRDDGYDITEYRDVHPEYGRLSDVKLFIAEAHKRGLRVITELVINHTSDQHKWFQRARKAKPGSAARNYYVWSDDDKKYADTRIIFLDTEKSNWTWDEEAKAYFWHRFYSHQPDLNFDNPQVFKSVVSAMHFWLDLGVDGLRLDAVPYLIEREGTNNENLPETHDILKRIRAEVDAHYPDRMLLAEANQWPEDTQIYFGEGDECHMAFHFPLMPRMYMALAQEDRFPITDIMRQTPPIPENCQWAIFLRNHDELTLEMVTDRERDYLWNTYAADPRARINLGIRRRLAPLLENDRRRIELMKSLLLTMPGTPVVYYGDEIGMGDNLHLGDRDGVRTPMQWSSDRNGGFSRADPASLVLPAIMSPIYGFDAINVEAQWRNPHSLLNWFRRMLVERRKHKAFGRGTIRFLHPHNRKVLAYLREYEDETILCIANVARTAQAVELDLAEFAGRTPVELSGDTAFPLIGQLTYLLTLPPYGFYWFRLSANTQPPVWSSAVSGPLIEHHTFVLRNALSEIGAGNSRAALLHDILPGYVRQRRWFQQKDKALEDVVLAQFGPLPGASDLLYTEISVTSDGVCETYALPLSVAWEDEALYPFEAALALARVRKGRRVGLLTDGFASPGLTQMVLAGLREQRTLSIGDNQIAFRSAAPLESVVLSDDAELEWPAAEQSNSTLVIDRKIVLKLFRKLNNGIHPESEMGRELTVRGFTGTPPFLGEVIRTDSEGHSATIMLAQAYVINQGDGWHWTLNRLGNVVDEGSTPFSDEERTAFLNYTNFAHQAGVRIGEMHALLSKNCDNADFEPEQIGKADAIRFGKTILAQFDSALSLKGTNDETRAVLRKLRERAKHIAGAVSAMSVCATGLLRTRIHGDLHLGQVLVTADDVMIIDFEGEPVKPLSERRAKNLPLHDVAGMLRSFDYAAAYIDRNIKQGGEQGEARATAILDDFRSIASDALIEGYEVGRGAALSDDERTLLRLCMLKKAAYEAVYEASNRPDWLIVPLRGLDALVDVIAAQEEAADA